VAGHVRRAKGELIPSAQSAFDRPAPGKHACLQKLQSQLAGTVKTCRCQCPSCGRTSPHCPFSTPPCHATSHKKMFLCFIGMPPLRASPISFRLFRNLLHTPPSWLQTSLPTRHLGRACLMPIGRCQTAPSHPHLHISSITYTSPHLPSTVPNMGASVATATLEPSKCVACKK
jgi:hypothetical protein